jgi:hypothetical protein
MLPEHPRSCSTAALRRSVGPGPCFRRAWSTKTPTASQVPILSPREVAFHRAAEKNNGLQGEHPSNTYKLPLLDHGVSEFVKPLRYWIASQFRARRVPRPLPFLLGREVAFQVLERPRDRTSLFQKVADGCFRPTLSWRIVKVLRGMSHGFQHFKRVCYPLSSRQRYRSHACPLLASLQELSYLGASHPGPEARTT